MVEAQVEVRLPHGLHIRPAAQLARLAQRYPGSIEFTCQSQKVDAKSLLALQTLEIVQGSQVHIQVDGNGLEASSMLQKLCEFLASPQDPTPPTT